VVGFCEHGNVPSGCDISGSYFGVPKNSSLLGYDPVSLGEHFQTFRIIMMYSPTGGMSDHTRHESSNFWFHKMHGIS
jgi:hypothetical protein